MNVVFLLINIIVIASICWLMWRRADETMRPFFWPAVMLKLCCGIGIGLLYTYYYPASDTITYHDDANILVQFARNHPVDWMKFMWSTDETSPVWETLSSKQPRALFIVKVCTFVNMITNGDYWISSLYFSLLSFAGAWKLSVILHKNLPGFRWQIAVAFLFLPSCVFWSAGIMKESVAVATLYFLSSLVAKAWFARRVSVSDVVLLPFSLLILWDVKYYYLALFAPFSFALLASRVVYARFAMSIVFKIIVWLMLIAAPLCLIMVIHPNFYPEIFFDVIVENYDAFVRSSSPEDVVRFDTLEPTAISMLTNAPAALFAGIFRPMLWEAHNVPQFLAAMENTIVLLLTLFSLSRLTHLHQSPQRLLIVSVLLYAVVLAIFLSLSTPNFGSLTRYKVGFISFYFLLISIDNPLSDSIIRCVQRIRGRLVR